MKLSRNSAIGVNLQISNELGKDETFSIKLDESILVGHQESIRIGTLFQTSRVPKMLPDGT